MPAFLPLHFVELLERHKICVGACAKVALASCAIHTDVSDAIRTIYAFYAFYAWWIYFPQSGALAEGTSRPVSQDLSLPLAF